mmetsp:Transcript_29057/g.27950  ORF Transcript_29057/g.27950 Transcript_29057/m.27950 type:complete len:140 (-) Transcript_29057:337-756(-)
MLSFPIRRTYIFFHGESPTGRSLAAICPGHTLNVDKEITIPPPRISTRCGQFDIRDINVLHHIPLMWKNAAFETIYTPYSPNVNAFFRAQSTRITNAATPHAPAVRSITPIRRISTWRILIAANTSTLTSMPVAVRVWA